MLNSNRATLCLALFMAYVEIGSCLECYHCVSQEDPKCLNNLTSPIKELDCAAKESDDFKKYHLYNILPANVFGVLKTQAVPIPRYCHKIVMESGNVIRTCLDGNATDIDQICNNMIVDTKDSNMDKKVKSCKACNEKNCNGGDDSKNISDANPPPKKEEHTSHTSPTPNNGAGALPMSLRLSTLTLFITYLLYK